MALRTLSITDLTPGASTAIGLARHYMTVGDIPAKSNAISKAIGIVEDGLKALGVEEGSEYHSLFKGPVGIAYAADPVTAAKVTAEFAKGNDKFVIQGGFMGDKVLDAKGVEALSKLPSLDQLRGKLIGLLQAPATKVAGVLQAPAGQLARVFNAYATKDAA